MLTMKLYGNDLQVLHYTTKCLSSLLFTSTAIVSFHSYTRGGGRSHEVTQPSMSPGVKACRGMMLYAEQF